MGNTVSSSEDNTWTSDARRAMDSGTSCVICGAPFDIEGDIYNIDPKDPKYQWMFEFRLLGRSSDMISHKVTSEPNIPLNVSNTRDIFLSEKARFDMSAAGYFRLPCGDSQYDCWFDTLIDDPGAGTIFPLHDACINISCRAIQDVYDEQSSTQQWPVYRILTDLLNAMYRKQLSRLHQPDSSTNDIFNLSSTSDAHGPRSVLAISRLDWWAGEYEKFYTDPISISALHSFLKDTLQSTAIDKQYDQRCMVLTRQPSGLECMPIEILDRISSFLIPKSVVALHRSSKALASKISLDDRFWRMRLLEGTLVPHIWDLDNSWSSTKSGYAMNWLADTHSQCNWKEVAKSLAKKQVPMMDRNSRLNEMPIGLWNRRRIWSIVQDALKQHLVDIT